MLPGQSIPPTAGGRWPVLKLTLFYSQFDLILRLYDGLTGNYGLAWHLSHIIPHRFCVT